MYITLIGNYPDSNQGGFMKVVFTKMIINGYLKGMIVPNEVIRVPDYQHAKRYLDEMMKKISSREMVEGFGGSNYIITDARIEEDANWNPRKS